MTEYKLGDYSKPQNKHDEFLLKTFPNIPLSLMRDIWNIHNDMTEEQQKDFLEASINNNWGIYDEKYNLKKVNIQYDNYETIKNNMKEQQEKIDLELKNKENLIENKIEEIEEIEE